VKVDAGSENRELVQPCGLALPGLGASTPLFPPYPRSPLLASSTQGNVERGNQQDSHLTLAPGASTVQNQLQRPHVVRVEKSKRAQGKVGSREAHPRARGAEVHPRALNR